MAFVAATDLVQVPANSEYHWYVFLLEDRWDDELRRQLRDNFFTLADEVGPRALVVKGGERFYDFAQKVYELYRPDTHAYQSLHTPALLITDIAPADLQEDPDRLGQTKTILLPLGERYREATSIVPTLRKVVEAIKDPQAIASLENPYENSLEGYWGWLPRYFELKPNFFGFGVNLNSMIEDLYKS